MFGSGEYSMAFLQRLTQHFKNPSLLNGIMNITTANLLMKQVGLVEINKNLRLTTKMAWRASSKHVTSHSIQKGDWSLFLLISIQTRGKPLYQLSSGQGLWWMEAGPSRQRWAIVHEHFRQQHSHPLSGSSAKSVPKRRVLAGITWYWRKCSKTSFRACATSGTRVFVVPILCGQQQALP